MLGPTMKRSDIYRLVVETDASEPTIRKWLKDPDSVQGSTAYALRAGCKKLGLVVTRGGPGPLTTGRANTTPDIAS